LKNNSGRSSEVNLLNRGRSSRGEARGGDEQAVLGDGVALARRGSDADSWHKAEKSEQEEISSREEQEVMSPPKVANGNAPI